MGVYLAVALLIPFTKILFWNKRRTFIFAVCLELFVLIAIRAEDLGSDALAYMSFFNFVSRFSFDEIISNLGFIERKAGLFEFGYSFMAWLFTLIDSDIAYRAFLIFLAFVNMWALKKFFNHYSESPCLAFFMFMCLIGPFSYFYIQRRMLAESIYLTAFPAMEEKRYVKAGTLMLIAFLCHRSAIIFTVFIYLLRIKVTKKIFQCAGITYLFLLVFANFLLKSITTQLLILFGKTYYIDDFGFNATNMHLILVASAILIYFTVDFRKIQITRNNTTCWLFLMFVLNQPIAIYFGLFGNLNHTFIIGTSIFLTNMLSSKKSNKHTKKIMYIVIFILLFLNYYRMLQWHPTYLDSSIPYRTMFE